MFHQTESKILDKYSPTLLSRISFWHVQNCKMSVEKNHKKMHINIFIVVTIAKVDPVSVFQDTRCALHIWAYLIAFPLYHLRFIDAKLSEPLKKRICLSNGKITAREEANKKNIWIEARFPGIFSFWISSEHWRKKSITHVYAADVNKF